MPFTLSLNSTAPPFLLAGTDGGVYGLESFHKARALVIFFTCNHCPYVVGSDEITRAVCEMFYPKGVAFIAINSNSDQTVPDDSFFKMCERMQVQKFPWVYLCDATQRVARDYGALRTPHFYLFDENRSLIYCGREIDSPRDAKRATVNDLENALNDWAHQRPVQKPLTNPIGCNVKWKNRERHWMPPEACDLI